MSPALRFSSMYRKKVRVSFLISCSWNFFTIRSILKKKQFFFFGCLYVFPLHECRRLSADYPSKHCFQLASRTDLGDTDGTHAVRIFRKPFANVHISRKVPFAHVWQIYACGPRSCKTFHGFLHGGHMPN